MESLEIHSKAFVIKWINVPESSVVNWQIKPLKKSICFAIYKKAEFSSPASPISPTTDFNKHVNGNSHNMSLEQRLESSNLVLVSQFGKLAANEIFSDSMGPVSQGVYAFVFDNTFSKSNSKKVLFAQHVAPLSSALATSLPSLSASSHNSHSASLPSSLASLAPPSFAAPFAAPFAQPPSKSGRPRSGSSASTASDTAAFTSKNSQYIEGYLLKKKRKKHQKAFSKRFFRLNFKQGILEYRMSSVASSIRGSMHLKHAVVTAIPKTKEITVDSGVEIWHLKAFSTQDFEVWLTALNSVKNSPVAGLSQMTISGQEEEDSSPIKQLKTLINEAKRLARGSNDTAMLEKLQSMEYVVANLKTEEATASSNESMVSQDFYDAPEYMVLIDGDVEYDDVNEDDTDTDGTAFVAESESSQSLYPLNEVTIPKRRNDMPEMTSTPPSLLSFFRSNVGKDLSSVAMPVTYNEPLTILQKFAEVFEYADLLNNLHLYNGPDRLLVVSSFAISYLSSFRSKERSIRKPFMPLLGETFELVRPELQCRIVLEKVCHKPPIFCVHGDSAEWSLSAAIMPVNKFWGKSLEIINKGSFKLVMKKTGETYEWNQPTTLLRNLIAGEKYIDPVDTASVTCSNGSKAVVEFKVGGMFSGRSEEVNIRTYDSSGSEMNAAVKGNWKESLYLCPSNSLKKKTIDLSTDRLVWQAHPLVKDSHKKWGFTQFAMELNEITSIEAEKLPPTDSRLRPDMRYYENGQNDKADEAKLAIEQLQRERRKEGPHKSAFFKKLSPKSSEDILLGWKFVEGEMSYWNRRKRGDWGGLLQLYENA